MEAILGRVGSDGSVGRDPGTGSGMRLVGYPLESGTGAVQGPPVVDYVYDRAEWGSARSRFKRTVGGRSQFTGKSCLIPRMHGFDLAYTFPDAAAAYQLLLFRFLLIDCLVD